MNVILRLAMTYMKINRNMDYEYDQRHATLRWDRRGEVNEIRITEGFKTFLRPIKVSTRH